GGFRFSVLREPERRLARVRAYAGRTQPQRAEVSSPVLQGEATARGQVGRVGRVGQVVPSPQVPGWRTSRSALHQKRAATSALVPLQFLTQQFEVAARGRTQQPHPPLGATDADFVAGLQLMARLAGEGGG